jgi:hypothetical protein
VRSRMSHLQFSFAVTSGDSAEKSQDEPHRRREGAEIVVTLCHACGAKRARVTQTAQPP